MVQLLPTIIAAVAIIIIAIAKVSELIAAIAKVTIAAVSFFFLIINFWESLLYNCYLSLINQFVPQFIQANYQQYFG